MDNYFSGFRDDFVQHMLKNNHEFIITFDANILLNLYRYEDRTRDNVLSLFQNIKSSETLELWLSHQAALEFNDNRYSVKNNRQQGFNEVRSMFTKFTKCVSGLSKIGGKTSNLDMLRKSLSIHIDTVNNVLSKYAEEVKAESANGKDKIYDKVFDIFSGHVGEPFNVEELEELYIKGKERYFNKVPPGFEDSNKSNIKSYAGVSIDSRYGDLIMWFQLIKKAEKSNKPLILVTEDLKGDWMSKDFQRVRPELINEHLLRSGQMFYAEALHKLDVTFKKILPSKLTTTAKNEIEMLSQSDCKWLDDIVDAFRFYGGECRLKDVYGYISQNSDRSFPLTWKTIVRRTIYNHCSELSAYLGGEDMFEKLSSGMYRLKDRR